MYNSTFEQEVIFDKRNDSEIDINYSYFYPNSNKLIFDEEIHTDNFIFDTFDNKDFYFKETSPQTDILGKKIQRDENFFEENIEKDIHLIKNNLSDDKLKEISSIEINEESQKNKLFLSKTNTNGKKCGRKARKDKTIVEKGGHTKESSDNIIRKIKSFFGKRVYKYLSKLSEKKGGLLKLDIKINKCLKKDYNLELFKKTLKEIYFETEISNKYKNKKQIINEKIIYRTYQENEELEFIKILNLTYIEAFEIFRRKLNPGRKISPELEKKIEGTNILNSEYFEDSEIFLKKIREQGISNEEKEEDIESYIQDVINLIIGFEKWFLDKQGRKRD